MGFAPAPLDRSVVGIARDAAGTRLELPSRGLDPIEDNFGIQITATRVIQQSGGRTELADTSRLVNTNTSRTRAKPAFFDCIPAPVK